MYFQAPLYVQDVIQGYFFKWGLTGLNLEFSFSKIRYPTKVEEPSLLYLLLAGGRTAGCIPSPKVLTLCELQTASSRILTQVTACYIFTNKKIYKQR